MKSVLKRTLATLLSLTMVLGMGFVGGLSEQTVSAAEGTSKVQSYADLVAQYGQNGDGFVYTGLEFYEADGKLTDYYVKSGDELTARVYIKSNMYVGESYILTLYDNTFFDIKLAGGPNSTTVSTGYTSNYQQAPINSAHPIVISNNTGHTLTTINLNNVGWIKNLCGFTAEYLAATDLAQSNTKTDTTVSIEAYDMTSDIWLFEYYVKIQPDLADGTKGIVSSPETLWHASMNGNKHDARKKAYIAVIPPADYPTKHQLTQTTTMAAAMDAGIIDHFVQDHEHEFTIGDAPAGGDSGSGGSVEGVSKVQSYADLVAQYGQNGDGFVYTGLEFFEADGKLTDYYVNPGDELTAHVYIKSNMYVGESYILTLYDNTFFDIKLAGGPNSTTVSTGYTSNYQQAPINANHPIVISNGTGHTLTTINLNNVGWIKNLCGFTTEYLAATDLAQSNTKTDTTVSIEAYDMTSDIWLFEYYVKIQSDLADGTKGIVTSPETLWHASMNGNKHDARKKAYIAVIPPEEYPTKHQLTQTTTMAAAMDAGIIDYFVQDHEHEFTIGEPSSEPVEYTVSFKLDDGTDYIDPATYLPGDEISAPETNPSKTDFVFLGWALEGTTDVLTFPQTMGDADVTYVAQFKAVPKYTATFIAEGEVISEAQYKEGETIVVPDAPEKDGFTFIGWSPVPGEMGTEDITFTAQYREKSAVYFMDGETQIDVVKGEAGDTVAEPEALSKEGYTFNGWVDADGTAVTFPVTITEGTTYIYASWTAVKYEVSFDNDGEITSDEVDFGSEIVFPVPADKKGHSFIGWFDANDNEYKDGATVPVGGVELTAKFEKNTYNAIFDADGGTWADGEKTKTVPTVYGEQIVAPADPEREGYKFLGWDSEVGTMSDADKTFTAVWQIQSYSATWDFGNGEEEQVDDVTYGMPVNKPADPVKEGYTFAGWTPEVPDAMPAGPLNFIAVWTVNEYTVTWDSGDDVTTETVKYGENVTSKIVSATGRNFLGWTIEGSTEYVEFPFAMPAKNVTFVADWEDIIYKATWDVDGVTTVDEYIYNEEIVAPADPVKEGYTFAGWTPSVPDAMPAEDVVFTATWTVNEYTVTWNNGGEITTETVKYGADVNEKVLSATGREFLGWKIEGSEEYVEFPFTMPASDVTFVAEWHDIWYEAIWDVDGELTKVSYHYNDTIVSIADPVKEGYTFAGWTPAVLETMPAENVTFTATWTVNEYTVTWNFDNGNETQIDTVKYGDVIAEPAKPVKTGYVFAGWDAEIPASMPANSLEFTATWEKAKFNAIFDANGGKFADGSDKVIVSTEFEAAVVAPEAPVKEGFAFVAWTPELSDSMPAEELTYTAIWAEGEGTVYTVETYTMDVNGEYGEAEIAYYATEDATVTLAPEAAEGFAVAEESVLEAEVAADGSTVLKVYFERNTYTFTFDANGGNFNGEATVTVDALYGAAVTAPDAPVMDEYNFDGWDAEVPETMPAENLTFKAKWVLAHVHTPEEVIEDATCTEDGKKYNKCTGCGETIGEAVTIPAKGHTEGDWKIVTDATYESEGLAIKKCTVCGEEIDSAVIAALIKITDENGKDIASDFEITYGESVTLTVSDKNIPDGATVEWIVEGDEVETEISEDGLSITITSVKSGNVKIKAVVVDADGEPVLDELGRENSFEFSFKSDACTFQRILFFFKSIFNCSIFKRIIEFIFG